MSNILTGFTRLWWIPLVTGIISIALGIWCLFSPVTSVPVMAYIFAVLFCLAGLVNAIFGLINIRRSPNRGWSLALGLLELIAGIWLFTLPEAELATTFVIIIGIWLIVVSINAICETVILSSRSALWSFLSVLLLVATIIFAFIFLSSPVATAIAGWLYLGFSLITFGVFRVFMATRIKGINRVYNNL